MDDKGKQFYDYLSSQGIEVPPSYEEFSTQMQNKETAGQFHSFVSSKGIEVPKSVDEFTSVFAPTKSTAPEKKSSTGPTPGALSGLGGSLGGPSPLAASKTPPKTTFGEGALEAISATRITGNKQSAPMGMGVKNPKAEEWKPTKLNPQEEEQFNEFMNNDPNVIAWSKEFQQTYGEKPVIGDGGYDYRGAWKAGQVPTPVKVNGRTEYHWGSIGEDGKDLKAPDHPTRWKSEYMEKIGKNPDEIGVTEKEAKEQIYKHDRISLIANNVTRNAVKYSPNGFPSQEVEDQLRDMYAPAEEYKQLGGAVGQYNIPSTIKRDPRKLELYNAALNNAKKLAVEKTISSMQGKLIPKLDSLMASAKSEFEIKQNETKKNYSEETWKMLEEKSGIKYNPNSNVLEFDGALVTLGKKVNEILDADPNYKAMGEEERQMTRIAAISSYRSHVLIAEADKAVKSYYNKMGIKVPEEEARLAASTLAAKNAEIEKGINRINSSYEATAKVMAEEYQNKVNEAVDEIGSGPEINALYEDLQNKVNAGSITDVEANIQLNNEYNKLIERSPKIQEVRAAERKARADYENEFNQYKSGKQAEFDSAEKKASESLDEAQLKYYQRLKAKYGEQDAAKTKIFSEKWKKMSFEDKWSTALTSGSADFLSFIGYAIGDSKVGRNIMDVSSQIKSDNPLLKVDYTTFLESVSNPDWWISNVVPSLPLTATLMIPGIGLASGASSGLAMIGAGTILRTVGGAAIGAVGSRTLEALVEGAGVAEELLAAGESPEYAAKGGSDATSENLNMVVTDYVQFASILLPTKGFGMLATKLGGQVISGSLEEIYQEGLINWQKEQRDLNEGKKASSQRFYSGNTATDMARFFGTPEGKTVAISGGALGLAFGAAGVPGDIQATLSDKRISAYISDQFDGLRPTDPKERDAWADGRRAQMNQTIEEMFNSGRITEEDANSAKKKVDFYFNKMREVPAAITKEQRTQLLDKLMEINTAQKEVDAITDETLKSIRQKEVNELKKQAGEIVGGTSSGYFVNGVSLNKQDFEIMSKSDAFIEGVKNGDHTVLINNDKETEKAFSDRFNGIKPEPVEAAKGKDKAQMPNIENAQEDIDDARINIEGDIRNEEAYLEQRNERRNNKNILDRGIDKLADKYYNKNPNKYLNERKYELSLLNNDPLAYFERKLSDALEEQKKNPGDEEDGAVEYYQGVIDKLNDVPKAGAAQETAPVTPEVKVELAPIVVSEDKTVQGVEAKRIETEAKIKRKDLFGGVGEFSTELGGSDKAAVPVSHKETNGIEFVEYAHPETGSVDVVVTGKSGNDFVGFYRIYENGKPTNKWSSKFENQSRNKEDFKTMISGVQEMLPQGHEYTEKTSISTDGLRVWGQQLSRGYELQYDENGKLKTNLVAINGDAIVNELGVPVEKGNFENIRVKSEEEFEIVKKALLPYLEKLGLNEGDVKFLTGTVKINLPVLKSKEQSESNKQTPTEPTKESPKEPVSESELNKKKADIEKRREAELSANKKLTEVSGGAVSGESQLANEINAKYDAELAALEKPAKPFISSFGTPVKDLGKTLEGVSQTNLDGVNVLMSEVDENTVKLESIETPKRQRDKGKAKAALQKIIDKADELGKTIILDVNPKNENSVSEIANALQDNSEPGELKRVTGFDFGDKEGSWDFNDMKTIAKAYQKAKKDGTNPSLVEAVEKIIKPTTEEGLRKLYEGFGFTPTKGIGMERKPGAKPSGKAKKGNVTSLQDGGLNFNSFLPSKTISGINPDLVDLSVKYKAQYGITENTPRLILSISEENGMAIADAYEQMKHDPDNPEVKASFDALITEIKQQADLLLSNGYKFELSSNKKSYESSSDMVKDVMDNKHVFVDPSSDNFGTTREFNADNIGLQDSGYKDVNGNLLTNVEVIRAVHDIFGHAKFGVQFGPIGEENAWRTHMSMFSPLAQKALTATTRGQNSWVNFNKMHRNKDGKVIKSGEPGFVKPEDKDFAEQKIGLLPDWAMDNAYGETVTIGNRKVIPVNKYIVSGQEIYEIDSAEAYHEAITSAKESRSGENIPEETRDGIQVHVNSIEDYKNIIAAGGKLLVSKDGLTGIKIEADGLIGGGFNHSDNAKKNALAPFLIAGIKLGARYTDAYDTYLPKYYARFGFAVSGRMKFNPDFAEEGWDSSILKTSPDVVFMYFNGGNRATIEHRVGQFAEYKKDSGEYFEDYDLGVAASKEKTDEKASLIPKAEVKPSDKKSDKKEGATNGNSVKVFAAPFYNQLVLNAEEAESVQKSPAYKKHLETIRNIADEVGLSVKSISTVIGGYTHTETGKQVREITPVIEFNSGQDFEKVTKFAAIMGALSPEVQETTIAARVINESERKTDVHTANLISIKVDNFDEALKLAQESGLDHSANINESKIEFLDFALGEDVDFDEKLNSFAIKLNEKGIKNESKGTAIESRLIGAATAKEGEWHNFDRKKIFEDIKREVDFGQRGQQFRDAIAKAEKRNNEFIRQQEVNKERIEYGQLREKEIELQRNGKNLTAPERKRMAALAEILLPNTKETFTNAKDDYEEAKAEIEATAKKIAEGVGFFASFDLKRAERAAVKALRWYKGQSQWLGDGARTNIIVFDEKDIEPTIMRIKEEYNGGIVRNELDKTDLGYPKKLLEVRTSNGKLSEFQVMTPEGYLAKDGVKYFPDNQKSFAQAQLSKVREKLGWAIPDGVGHYFYEIDRDSNVPESLRNRAKSISLKYYDAFLNPNSTYSETEFRDDVSKFKKDVDNADKSEWDDGNKALSPETLNDFLSSKPKTPSVKELSKKEAAKSLADRIREMKTPKGNTMLAIDFGLTEKIYNAAIDIIANQVEKETELGKAIQAAVEFIENELKGAPWNKKAFEDSFSDLSDAGAGTGNGKKKRGKGKGPKKGKKKSYEARQLKEFADSQVLTDAIKATGTRYEAISWKDVEPISNSIVADIFSDPSTINEKAEALADTIAKTTTEDYRNNKELATLHALVAHHMIAEFARIGDIDSFQKWSANFSDDSRNKGQFISAMQFDASPYAISNRETKRVYDEMGEALGRLTPDGSKIQDVIDELRKKLELTEGEVKRLEGIVAAITAAAPPQTSPSVTSQPPSPQQQKKGMDRVKSGLSKLGAAIRGTDRQLNAFMPINAEMIDAIREIALGIAESGVYQIEKIRAAVMKQIKDAFPNDKNAVDSIDAALDGILEDDAIEEAMDDAEEASFVEKLVARAKANAVTKAPKPKTAEQVLLDTLLAKVNETIKREGKPVKLDESIRRIKEGIQEAEFGDDVWQEAMNNIAAWLETQPNISDARKQEILAQMEDSVAAFMDQPFANSDLRKALKSGTKDLGIEIKNLVKQHWTKQNAGMQSIENRLIYELGLSIPDAQRYSAAIVAEINSMFEGARKAEINRMLGLDADGNVKGKKSPVNSRVSDKIIAAINLGVMDDLRFRGMFAEKYGFTELTPKDIKMIRYFNDLINIHQGNELSQYYLKQMMDYIENLKPYDAEKFFNTTKSLMIRGMLNGMGTMMVNIPVGSQLSYMASMYPMLMSNPVAAALFRKEFGAAGLGGIGIRTFGDIMMTGFDAIEGSGKKFDDRKEVRGDQVDYWLNNYDGSKMWEDVRNAKSPKEAINAMRIAMGRSMIMTHKIANYAQAFDAIISYRATELDQFIVEYNKQAKAAGYSGLRARFDPTVGKKILDAVKAKMAYDTDTKNRIADEVDDEIAGMRARGERVGFGLKQRLIKSKMESMRDADNVKASLDRFRASVLMEAPTGFGGQAYEMVADNLSIQKKSSWMKAGGKHLALSMFGLFLRISVTSVQKSIENTPVVGLVLPGIFYDRKLLPVDPLRPNGAKEWRTVRQDNDTMRAKLMTHAAVMAIFTMAAMSMFTVDDEDDELGRKQKKLKLNPDRWIDITGYGTGKWYDNEQLGKDGKLRKDYTVSIKVNGKWHDILPARLIPHFLPFIGFLGGLRDESELNPADFKNMNLTEQFIKGSDDVLLASTVMSFATIPRVTESLFYAAFNKESKWEATTSVTSELASIALNPAKTAMFPNLLRDFKNEYEAIKGDTARTGKGVLYTIAKDLPVSGEMVGDEAHDVFGYPKTKTSKILTAVQTVPGSTILLDNFFENRIANEPRFKNPVWVLKGKYQPNLVIASYSPKSETPEDKNMMGQVYGEQMRNLWLSHEKYVKAYDFGQMTELQNMFHEEAVTLMEHKVGTERVKKLQKSYDDGVKSGVSVVKLNKIKESLESWKGKMEDLEMFKFSDDPEINSKYSVKRVYDKMKDHNYDVKVGGGISLPYIPDEE